MPVNKWGKKGCPKKVDNPVEQQPYIDKD